VFKAMHLLGSLGVSNHTPLAKMWSSVLVMGMADGPTEVHLMTVARMVLKKHKGVDGQFPSEYLPHRKAEARAAWIKEHGALPAKG
ncbi:MAG: acyl-CoA dehydrogenase-like protein, partial [Caulobacteraceae bacterium]|nr:acyl-CoA dehydrogenase-like protein [Caulobacteraceae bacterium]